MIRIVKVMTKAMKITFTTIMKTISPLKIKEKEKRKWRIEEKT